MSDNSTFSPDWVSSPGDSIADAIQERGLTLQEFSERIGIPLATTTDLLHGTARLTAGIAQSLELLLGTPASFWLRRESHYRRALSTKCLKWPGNSYRQWLSEIPLSDMTRLGWVNRRNTQAEQVSECLDFFGKGTIADWAASSDDFLRSAAMRTSPTFSSKPGALHAWLRKGELEAAKMTCAPWNAAALRVALVKIRTLTRVRDPAVFLPRLTQICAACGVAVVVTRTPNGCRASGAAKFLSGGKGLILLSFRYLSDDHFWFTFFHEVAHLLLHPQCGLFLEGNQRGESKEEEEANEFSARILIPGRYENEMKSLASTAFAIARFAKRIGVSPGIVVGQLQHLEIVPRQRMNNLKVRFQWTD